ncbi:hypothetical protein RB594_009099 [Gaeumannomyces avenae]
MFRLEEGQLLAGHSRLLQKSGFAANCAVREQNFPPKHINVARPAAATPSIETHPKEPSIIKKTRVFRKVSAFSPPKAATMATRKVRYKKLSVKTLLPVVLYSEIDQNEYESLKNEQISTGVESAEENEYHLQAVLQTSGTAADKEIPVPPPQESKINYNELYPVKFNEPTHFIRFSQTVEECIGCRYDMTEDDEVFLKRYNQDRAAQSQLSEDDFERIMEVYEDTASIQAPYASVDHTVIPYDQMVPGLNELDSPKLMTHAKALYEYWKQQRQAKKGPLHASLKFETHQETDEGDPFVCFRRREVRQTRKTRARDVQSADKLKRLRRELEEGRELVQQAHRRELMKRDMLHVDRAVFEQRAKLRALKIHLNIKTDDEDLYNTKPQKKKQPPAEPPSTQRPVVGALRAPPRPGPDGRPSSSTADNDLIQLSDQLLEKEAEMRLDIENKIENHRKWNLNHIDLTRDALEPLESQKQPKYRPVKIQYLMTPPNSASAEGLEEPTPMDLDQPEPVSGPGPLVRFQGLAEDDEEYCPAPKEYRRRIGRLNRLWIDRREINKPRPDPSAGGSDRWKYDDDSEDDELVCEVDPYDLRALKFRASIPFGTPGTLNRRGEAQNGVVANGAQAATRQVLPPPLASALATAAQQQQQHHQQQQQAGPS